MRIKSKPENFSGARQNAIFEIDGTESIAVIEVFAKDSQDNTIGTKRVSGEAAYSINIAPYLRGMAKVEPYSVMTTGFMNHAERMCRTRIKAERMPVGDLYFLPIFSEWVNLTAGTESANDGTMLSEAPPRIYIPENSFDEIAFCTSGADVYAEITVSAGVNINTIRIANACNETRSGQEWFTCVEGMTALHINIQDILIRAAIPKAERIEVRLYKKTATKPESELFASREYRVIQGSSNGVQLCWLNQHGAIDHYSFEGICKEEISTKKNTVRTDTGNIITGIETGNSITVVSRCEPIETMRWLAGIATAENVWLRENGEYREVYVDDVDVRIYDCSEPAPLTLNIWRK